jgi:acyl-CoA hydrolase
VHVDDIDYLVYYDEPLVESIPIKKENEISERIGRYVSQLVDDGATIQIGFGHLPYAILKYLDRQKRPGRSHTGHYRCFFTAVYKKSHHQQAKKLPPGKNRCITLYGV